VSLTAEGTEKGRSCRFLSFEVPRFATSYSHNPSQPANRDVGGQGVALWGSTAATEGQRRRSVPSKGRGVTKLPFPGPHGTIAPGRRTCEGQDRAPRAFAWTTNFVLGAIEGRIDKPAYPRD